MLNLEAFLLGHLSKPVRREAIRVNDAFRKTFVGSLMVTAAAAEVAAPFAFAKAKSAFSTFLPQ